MGLCLTLALLVATFVAPVSMGRGVHLQSARHLVLPFGLTRVVAGRSGRATLLAPWVDAGEVPNSRARTVPEVSVVRTAALTAGHLAQLPPPPLVAKPPQSLRI